MKWRWTLSVGYLFLVSTSCLMVVLTENKAWANFAAMLLQPWFGFERFFQPVRQHFGQMVLLVLISIIINTVILFNVGDWMGNRKLRRLW